MRWLRHLAILALALAGGAATGDSVPEIVAATPGSTGSGAIGRFTARFSEAMVPLGDPRAASPFSVTCPVGGAGRWVDQQTFVWDFTTPLPGGLTCTFAVRDGLKSLRQAAVGGTHSFTVDTGGPAARAVLAGRTGDEIEEDPVFLVATNVAADRRSVGAEGYCAVDGIGEKIALDVLGPAVPAQLLGALGPRYQATDFLDEAGLPETLPANPAARARTLRNVIAVKCRRPLPPGRDMALVWSGAIRAAAGARTAGADKRFDFTVRKAFEARFECSRVNPQAGCSPVEDAFVRFAAPIPLETAKAIRLEIDGRQIAPTLDNQSTGTAIEVKFAKPFAEGVAGRVLLPPDVRDESGRPLANARRFPLAVRFDPAPPLVKFAATFGILEAKEGGVLPVTVRNVEPALAGRVLGVGGAVKQVIGSDAMVASWLQRVTKAGDTDTREEKHSGKTVPVNYTGATPILAGARDARTVNVALPGGGKAFEVVGIPLARPGFYVVELASPTLGAALLGRRAPRYVATAALVTNMAVHFKWGRGASLAWVTALDSGHPVAGAEVQIADGCTGRSIARGVSDAQGRLLVKGGLPEPNTYGGCGTEDGQHPLMVSARLAGDFSFTMTQWAEGIRPYDFDLPYGWSASGAIIHTVFDRTLIRQGETVNMKQILRRPTATGFAAEGLEGTLRLTHAGSDTQFDVPLRIGRDGVGETQWTAPKGAPLGDYALSVVAGDKTIETDQTLRVDEYRLPTMRATVAGPKPAQVRPSRVPLDLFVGYLSGGGAGSLPVSVRAAFETDDTTPKGWDGWSFGGKRIVPGVAALDGDNDEITTPLPAAQTLPLTLDAGGAARTAIDVPKTLDGTSAMTVEMDYQDANGETLTASRRIALYSSAIRVGLKTDGWLMKDDDLRLKLAAITVDGRPVAGRRIHVALYSREILSARRRLIGGFYAYDNSARTTLLGASCNATTDAQGLADCAIDPGVSGEVYAVATATDDGGNETRASQSVWLAGQDEWWFGGDNGDRMDLVPEAKSYRATDIARFQVRMPFRDATALVTVEREGVLSSFVTELSGKNPVVEVPLQGMYAPDVYVSVMAVRGRVGGWRLWLADFARRWHLPFFSREGARPTALVDLAKPSFRLGIAKIAVGWDAHALKVDVATDRPSYRVRDVAQVAVRVRTPDGRPAAGAEIAFAAVDEALLQLHANDSWTLIDAMMGERPLSVITATGQSQVVGKRHYGRKALAAGGGGGGDLAGVNRADFRPVLLWRGRVPLDAQGRARIAVPLSDALSGFRMVAVATAGAERFGTGDVTVRTTQDLALYPALPSLVRTGDHYGAQFTLRNGSDHAMTVTATAETFPRIGAAPPLTVTIPAGSAAPVTWNLPAPEGIASLRWTVRARTADGRAADQVTAMQTVIPAVPLETWAATLARVGPATTLSIGAPAGALPGRGGVEVRLSNSLAPPLEGVRAYMAAYPFGCLEQLTSKAVVANDRGAWNRIAGDLPAYLDPDGLLRYFPIEGEEGSEALTAYILSITAEAGFTIPDGQRARMIGALQGVVEGRLHREGASAGDARYVKVAALAALARAGAPVGGLVARAAVPPADLPTALLADWLVVLDRAQAAAPAKAAVEAELRRRIVYEGTRLDLVDAANAPWWMMTGDDEMALKALLAILGRPGWQGEAPRMMVGVALRQVRGHWDTTPANAWGTIAARRFASLYPPGAVAGTTSARLGAVTRTASWPASVPPLLRLPLPAAPAPLLLAHAGGAGPWAEVRVVAAVPLARPLFAGYRIARQVSAVRQAHPGRLTRGDVLKVRLTLTASVARNWVVLSDPVPAGATIVGDLGGQSAALAAEAKTGEGASPAYVERGQESWRGYFDWLPEGTTTVEYVVRLNSAGTFGLPPTTAEAMYSPAIRAALPNRPLSVAAR